MGSVEPVGATSVLAHPGRQCDRTHQEISQRSEMISIPSSGANLASWPSAWPLGNGLPGLQVSCTPPETYGSAPHQIAAGPFAAASLPSTPVHCASGSPAFTPPPRLRAHLAAVSDTDLGRHMQQANPLALKCILTSLSVSLDDAPAPSSCRYPFVAGNAFEPVTCTITPRPHPADPALAPSPKGASPSPSPTAFGPAAGVSPFSAAAFPEGASGSFTPAPAAPSPPPAAKSVLLTVSPALPRLMQRPLWSLADYDISRRIFKGASSSVYQATCKRSGLPVALKIYFLSRVPSNATHMVAREITIHSDLTHKNIITLYAAFQEEGRLVLVQEYALRGDLHNIHRNMGRRMTEDQVRQLVLAPFLEALAYLHAKGICHRDIKPENLLFSHEWRIKIADFGVSINMHEERAVTRAGTLDYMAPEVERCPIKYLPHDNKNNPYLAYTTAVDIWAVGVLAYELLVGFPPFIADPNKAPPPPVHQDSSPAAQFLATHATRDALTFPTSLSAGARDFISCALAERPEDRPTAVDLFQHPWLRSAVQRHLQCSRPASNSSSSTTTTMNTTTSAPGHPAAFTTAAATAWAQTGPVLGGQVGAQQPMMG